MAIIKNKIMWIYGLPWSGKTFFAMLLASTYAWPIYSNVDFFKNWKIKSKHIEKMSDINAIKFCDIKGVEILDESGINISSRRSMSEQNMEFLELWMLWRKKNIDIIVISQLMRSVDVVMRELCTYSFTMDSWFNWPNYLKFEVEIKWRFDNLIWKKEVDLIKFSNLTGWTYDTKEDSVIKRTTRKEVETKDNINSLRASILWI